MNFEMVPWKSIGDQQAADSGR